jgi:hypothetical protein
MTAQEMLDHVFHQQDEPDHPALERDLPNDPESAERLARLGRAVALLVDDGEDYPPPPDLAVRTLALVERRRSRPQVQDFVPSRVPFRLADLAVAATVFFAAVFTLSVPILRSRAQMDQVACAHNLGQIGVSLAKYSTTHGTYPNVPVNYPAGAYGVMLTDSKALHDPDMLLCPTTARERHAAPLPDLDRFHQIVATSPEAGRRLFDGHFAYNVGYRRPSGEAVPVSDIHPATVPVASDGPPWSEEGGVLDGNSPNHGGRGQNVLYSDGHVSWRRNRWISANDRDLYLNEERLPAPGLHATDSVVIPSVVPVRFK